MNNPDSGLSAPSHVTAGKAVRVLLVEDYPADVIAVRAILERSADARFEIEVAGRLSAAQALLRAGVFNVILLDLGLPDSNGLDTIRGVRAAAGDTPIVVLTATAEKEIAKEALTAGAQDFFVKAMFDSQLLSRAILRRVGAAAQSA